MCVSISSSDTKSTCTISVLPPTFTDEGIRAALAAQKKVPGLPILVLSQYVEQLSARELRKHGESPTPAKQLNELRR